MKTSKLLALVLSMVVIGAMMIVGVSAADVAEINGTHYADLNTAFSAVQPNETIKVLADVEISVNELNITKQGVTVEGIKKADDTYPTITFNDSNYRAFGIYVGAEQVTIKNLNLVNGTAVDVSGSHYELFPYYKPMIDVSANKVIIENCTLQNTNNQSIIAITAHIYQLQILNCKINGFSTGVYSEPNTASTEVYARYIGNEFNNVNNPINGSWPGNGTDGTVVINNNTIGQALTSGATPYIDIIDFGYGSGVGKRTIESIEISDNSGAVNLQISTESEAQGEDGIVTITGNGFDSESSAKLIIKN